MDHDPVGTFFSGMASAWGRIFWPGVAMFVGVSVSIIAQTCARGHFEIESFAEVLWLFVMSILLPVWAAFNGVLGVILLPVFIIAVVGSGVSESRRLEYLLIISGVTMTDGVLLGPSQDLSAFVDFCIGAGVLVVIYAALRFGPWIWLGCPKGYMPEKTPSPNKQDDKKD